MPGLGETSKNTLPRINQINTRVPVPPTSPKSPPKYQKKRITSLAYLDQSLVIMRVMVFLLKMIIVLKSLGKKQRKLAPMLHSEEQYLKGQTTARKKGQIFCRVQCDPFFFCLSRGDYRANIFLRSILHFAI